MELTVGGKRRSRGRRTPDQIAWRCIWLLAALVVAAFVWVRLQPPEIVVRTDAMQRAIIEEKAKDPLPAVMPPGL